MSSPKEIVEEQIASNGVVVYTKSDCHFCTMTKKLLNELGAKFENVELDSLPNGRDLQDALEEITGQATVPNTFINGKSVGGNSDLKKLHKAGNLAPLLQQVGAL